jgi:hypothetical protein
LAAIISVEEFPFLFSKVPERFMDEKFADARAEGFRDPPDRTTPACRGYMARIIEVREFISLFFNMVKSFESVTKLVPPEKLNEKGKESGGQFLSFEYEYSRHRQFVNEVLLTRAVESFELYVLTILRELFTCEPNMLRSESPLDAATVIALRNFDDVVFYLAERRLRDLAYKPLTELSDYISSRTGISLFKNEETTNAVILATEIRNLIAHNDCKVSEQFKRRTQRLGILALSMKLERSSSRISGCDRLGIYSTE